MLTRRKKLNMRLFLCIELLLLMLFLAALPCFANIANADEISGDNIPFEYKCSLGNTHHTIWGATDGTINDAYGETLSNTYAPTISWSSGSGDSKFEYVSHRIEPSGIVDVKKNILNGSPVFTCTYLRAGTAKFTWCGKFPDGCTLTKTATFQIADYPFDIKKKYVLKVGGEPAVIKYTGDQEGKIEVSISASWSANLEPLLKTTLSDNDATLAIELFRAPDPRDEIHSVTLTTYERERGDDTWPTFGRSHSIEIVIQNDDQEQPITPTDKQVKEIDPQVLRAYTSLLYPFYIEHQFTVSPTNVSITSSDSSVVDASYTTGTLRINGKKAGTATLTIKADNALYDYSMDVTVNAVPIKSENINANSTGMRFSTMLGGKNVPEGAEATLEANEIKNGAAFDALQKHASNNAIGVYSVNLGVDGTSVHDDFGTIDITFPLPEDYARNTVKVHHLHEATNDTVKAGEITTDIVPVINGEATITVSDLSTFALEAASDAITNTAIGTGINGNTSGTMQVGQSQIPGKNGAALSEAGDGLLLKIGGIIGLIVVAAIAALVIIRMWQSASRQ